MKLEINCDVFCSKCGYFLAGTIEPLLIKGLPYTHLKIIVDPHECIKDAPQNAVEQNGHIAQQPLPAGAEAATLQGNVG
jgi:hypothetical protein